MLKHHVNRIYRENKDMQAIIAAVQPELDAAFQKAQDYFADTFAIIATEDGVLRWEIILGITADPTTEPLQFRRERILNRLASNVPFTETWLRQTMDRIMGVGAWSYTLSIQDFILIIESLRPGKLWLNEMSLTLDKAIPANMLWYLIIYYQMWRTPYENEFTWQDGYERYATWQNAMEGIEIE